MPDHSARESVAKLHHELHYRTYCWTYVCYTGIHSGYIFTNCNSFPQWKPAMSRMRSQSRAAALFGTRVAKALSARRASATHKIARVSSGESCAAHARGRSRDGRWREAAYQSTRPLPPAPPSRITLLTSAGRLTLAMKAYRTASLRASNR